MEPWVTFDCYGTLIDWDRGIRAVLAEVWPDQPTDQVLADVRAVEPLVQQDGSLTYREVLRRVLRTVAALRDLPLPDEQSTALAESLPHWPAFPEVPAALAELRRAGWKLAILSNTDTDYLEASMAHLGITADLTVVASAIGSYKPAPAHWHEFRRRVGGAPDRHVHVAASLFHDIAPCTQLGVPAVWINRLGEESDLPRAAELTDLEPLPRTLASLSPDP